MVIMARHFSWELTGSFPRYIDRMYLKIGNIPRIKLLVEKSSPIFVVLHWGITILILRSASIAKFANIKDIHVAHRQPPIRWVACLRVYGRLAMPCYSGQAAHFFIIDIPCRAAREKITQKVLLVPRFGTMPYLLCSRNQ